METANFLKPSNYASRSPETGFQGKFKKWNQILLISDSSTVSERSDLVYCKTNLFLGKLFVDGEPLLEGDSLLSLALVFGSRGLDDHGVSGLQSGGADNVTDLSTIDLAVEFLIIEVENFFEL